MKPINARKADNGSENTVRISSSDNNVTAGKKTLSDLYDWIFESRSREMKFYAVASAIASVMVIMLIAAPATFFTIVIAAAAIAVASAVQKRADERLRSRGHVGSTPIKTMQ